MASVRRQPVSETEPVPFELEFDATDQAARPTNAIRSPTFAPATPVAAKVPVFDWRFQPTVVPPKRTSEQLAASLWRSSTEVDLYDSRRGEDFSFKAINKATDAVRLRNRQSVDLQRNLSLDALASDSNASRIVRGFRKSLDAPQAQSSRNSASVRAAMDRTVARLLHRFKVSKGRKERIYRASKHHLMVENWAKSRADLKGLPFADYENCTLDYDPAVTLQRHSDEFRRLGGRRVLGASERPINRDVSDTEHFVESRKWTSRDISALEQILQVQPESTREALVARLAGIPGTESTAALARRAVYDTSAEVREKAASALTSRDVDDVRPILMAALRYPWAPAAEHAAQVLVKTNDVEAVPQLEKLAQQRDPCAPFQRADGTWAVRELVRINHLRNCYLCHAPSVSEYDTVRGFVPSPSEPLPRLYYSAPSGYFVRADVTYLRQDFSVKHSVEQPGPWPNRQRFDYLVRTRAISHDEAIQIHCNTTKASRQRKAIVYALQNLTRHRPGGSQSRPARAARP